MSDIELYKAPVKVLSLYLGEDLFGLPIEHIEDVIGKQNITRVPLANKSVIGVMNLRGRIVMIIDLAKRLMDFDHTHGEDLGMNVVMDYGHELYSLYVDRVGTVFELDPERIENVPLTLNAHWRAVTSAVYRMDDKIMVLLDPEKLLNVTAFAEANADRH